MNTPLTPEDRERFDIVSQCIARTFTNAEAAAKLRLTIRQVQNLKREVRENGEQGIVHGNRGKESNRSIDTRVRAAAIAFMQKKKHHDFGPTFMQEQLLKQKGISIATETARSIMTEVGIWKVKSRRGSAIHREWRQRMALRGELVQFDGSYHDWFERGTEACLLGAIDDATGRVPHAVFEDNEGVVAVFRFWWAYIERHGRPGAIYLDKFSTYKLNHKGAVDNPDLMTQFQRAMSELDVRVICANSPEAKGRVERLFGTLQDRLVKEMRLAGVKTKEEANVFLKKKYLPDHNWRFSVAPRNAGDAHRPLTNELRAQLPAIFSVQSSRRVNNDYTLRFKNQWLQLKASKGVAVYKGDIVTLEERLDGSTHVRLRNVYLEFQALPERPTPSKKKVTALVKKKPAWKPAADHPWRKEKARAAEEKAQRNNS